MIRNRVLIWLVIFLSAMSCSMMAATPEETEAQMDKIKLDETMIYGEDFNDNKEVAYQNALNELLLTANELRMASNASELAAADLNGVAKELSYRKGTRNVVMLYMPRTQALKLKHGNTAAPTPPQPAQKPTPQPSTPTPAPAVATPPADEIIDAICSQDNWMEIKGFLSDFKRQGKITDSGSTKTSSEVPQDAYAILFDELGGILAILSPKNSGQRIDYRTNRTDTESNHSNYKFILWYK